MLVALLLAQQAQILPPDVVAAAARWGSCNALRRGELVAGPQSAEAVTDAVLATCAEHERSMLTALTAAFGPERAGAMVGDLRARFRVLGIAAVGQLRGGPPVTDDNFVWGQCVGRRATELGALPDAPDALDPLIERAFAACAGQEQVVRARWERERGAALAASYIATVRAQMRERLIHDLSERRSRAAETKAR